MWIELKDTLINISNLSGVTISDIKRGESYAERPGEIDHRVLLYSAGKCWTHFDFRSKSAQIACYDLLKHKMIRHNFDKGELAYDD